MKKLSSILIAVIFFYSCNNSDKAVISINIQDAKDSSGVIVSQLSLNKIVPIDTLYTKNGKAVCKMECDKASPKFIYFGYNGKNTVSAVVLRGDKIVINLNSEGKLLSLTGSPESEKMQEFEILSSKFNFQFDSLSTELLSANQRGDIEVEERINKDLGALYIAHKRQSIKYIFDNPKSITLIPVIYQNIASQLPVFAELNDVLIFKKVYDSLQPLYPNSPFIISLADDISKRMNLLGMNNKVQQAQHINFPDISLLDINADVKTLSKSCSKLTILLFWTAADVNQRLFNSDLKGLYEKYNDRGLEVYQVSLDSDKTYWATQVKDQNLPWVSVCDNSGVNSQYAALYNITKLPSMFLISGEGNIIGKDIFDIAKLESTIKQNIK